MGDIVSVIDMPPTEDRSWWRGKRGFQVSLAWGGQVRQGTVPARVAYSLTPNPLQVGFFPSECVELFTERPGPGLKGGKCQGQNVEASLHPLLAIHSLHLLFTHRCRWSPVWCPNSPGCLLSDLR